MNYLIIWLSIGLLGSLVLAVWNWFDGDDMKAEDVPYLLLAIALGPIAAGLIAHEMLKEHPEWKRIVLIKGRKPKIPPLHR